MDAESLSLVMGDGAAERVKGNLKGFDARADAIGDDAGRELGVDATKEGCIEEGVELLGGVSGVGLELLISR